MIQINKKKKKKKKIIKNIYFVLYAVHINLTFFHFFHFYLFVFFFFCTTDQQAIDAREFDVTTDALSHLGFGNSAQQNIFKVLAGILSMVSVFLEMNHCYRLYSYISLLIYFSTHISLPMLGFSPTLSNLLFFSTSFLSQHNREILILCLKIPQVMLSLINLCMENI